METFEKSYFNVEIFKKRELEFVVTEKKDLKRDIMIMQCLVPCKMVTLETSLGGPTFVHFFYNQAFTWEITQLWSLSHKAHFTFVVVHPFLANSRLKRKWPTEKILLDRQRSFLAEKFDWHISKGVFEAWLKLLQHRTALSKLINKFK